MLLLVTAATIVMVATSAGGCGSDQSTADTQDHPEGSAAFIEILRGLKRAALSGQTYPALQRARDLNEAERAVVKEFCNNVVQIRFNHEVHFARHNRAYVVERVTRYAAYQRGEAFTDWVIATMDRLERVIDLGSFDSRTLKNYERACYE